MVSTIIFQNMVKYYRQQKGWTMKQLAEKMGKSESAVSRWESGSASPKIEDINKLADIFGVNSNDLVFESGKNKKNELSGTANDHKLDLAKVADDDSWNEWLSAGGKPLSDRDKEMLRAMFGDKIKGR